MPTLLTTSLLAFVVCLLLTPGWRRLLLHWRPAQRREVRHGAAGSGVIPRLGGISVMAAAALALAGPRLMAGDWAWPAAGSLWPKLAGPVLLMLLVGAADDIGNLPPLWKFGGQALAALWVAALGIRVHAVLHMRLPAPLSAAVTVLWLVGCSSAFNLIDGMDGLATGLALFATGTVLAHAVMIGEPALALVMGALFGALAGFLMFNFPPASIYLGDTGSLSIGFVLGCMALVWANKATTMIGISAPLLALLVPLMDTVVTMARRGFTRRPLFAGDARHIHHRLLQRGLSPRRAVLVLYGVAALGAVASLVLADMRQRHSFEIVILLLAFLCFVGLQQLGYAEFQVGSLLRRGALDPRRGLEAQLVLRQFSDAIAGADGQEAIWTGLCWAAAELGFDGVELSSRQWSRRAEFPQGSGGRGEFFGWSCRLPLGEGGRLGQVTFWRHMNRQRPTFVDELSATLGQATAARLAEMERARAGATPAGAAAH
ncbi:MAG: glycosyltransferase family 4 protein [Terriglobales bacterium]